MTISTRRRRSPAEAQTEILDAAERLIRERPTEELTVSTVMACTTLTRNAFYAYFRDRYELASRLVFRLRADADARLAGFEDPEGDLATAGRAALLAAARLWAEHGELLIALADAAQRDEQAARAWREFTEPAEAAAIRRVRADVARGRISGIEPAATVRALVAMNRACFRHELVGKPDADVEALVDTLHAIWMRTLYETG